MNRRLFLIATISISFVLLSGPFATASSASSTTFASGLDCYSPGIVGIPFGTCAAASASSFNTCSPTFVNDVKGAIGGLSISESVSDNFIQFTPGASHCEGLTNDQAGSQASATLETISATATADNGGVTESSSGETDTMQVFGTCNGSTTNLGPCIQFNWNLNYNFDLGKNSGTGGTTSGLVEYDVYISTGTTFGVGKATVSYSESAPYSISNSVSGSFTWNGFTIGSGDTILWGQYVETMVISQIGASGSDGIDPTLTFTSLQPCTTGSTSNCVYFGMTAAQQQGGLVTPVFPFGSILAVITPLAALVVFTVYSTRRSFLQNSPK